MTMNFKNELIFFGGCDANMTSINFYNDLYFFNFGIDDCLDILFSKLNDQKFCDLEFKFKND